MESMQRLKWTDLHSEETFIWMEDQGSKINGFRYKKYPLKFILKHSRVSQHILLAHASFSFKLEDNRKVLLYHAAANQLTRKVLFLLPSVSSEP